MKNSFKKDIAVLLIISILIGSLSSGFVSYISNVYFSKTISSLVGDYGEFDLLLQAREEVREDTAAELQRIINESFPGGKVKEGPTITGKTSFFIALPDQFKTRAIYENINKTFSSVPGGAGVGIYTEPRLTVRGIPEGARLTTLEQIAKMEGVRFAFLDGSKVGVVLNAIDRISPVSEQIKNYLNQYQVVEITFPAGSEPSNAIRTGDTVAGELQKQLPQSLAQNVSISGNKDEMVYMVSTMLELKRFLNSYASTVTIRPTVNNLIKGETLVFQGKAPAAPASGAAPDKNNLLMEITGVQPNGVLEGRIMQGDATDLTNAKGYRLENGVIGTHAGDATVKNPRLELGNGLGESAKLSARVPSMIEDAQNLSGVTKSALQNYRGAVDAVQRTLTNLNSVGAAIQAATSGLAAIDTARLETQLNNSSQAMENVINTLEVIKLLQGSISGTVDNLRSAQNNILSLRSGIRAIGNVATDARNAQASIDRIVSTGQQTLATLKAFDVDGALFVLSNVDTRLSEVKAINMPLITAQIQYLAAAIPQLKDDEINQSVKLLDKFIAGQVIPSARIQILMSNNTPADSVTPLVEKEVGHKNFAVYSGALGVIEPNVQGELLQVLLEVKAILAGMTAIVMTVAFLVLDHTGVMAYIRRKRLLKTVKPTGWRRIAAKLTSSFVAAEKRYGMAIGAVLLTAIFLLSGGGIPYLPWIGVPFIGALIGLAVAHYAEKISPVSSEEVMAGEALGMSMDEVMREVVIPNGRPGLLQKLNRRKLKIR
ncbi:MAG: hypothetical protein K0Q77_2230 [Anaerosporomusa subterranea]|jgi:hypothetical protein|nr:hypothetical protein [Anaerosporomusa subterranea]